MTLKDEVRIIIDNFAFVTKHLNRHWGSYGKKSDQATEAIMERVRERVKLKITEKKCNPKGGCYEGSNYFCDKHWTQIEALDDLLTEMGGTDDKR